MNWKKLFLTAAAAAPVLLSAKDLPPPPDVLEIFEGAIQKAQVAYREAERNYKVCDRECREYGKLLNDLEDLARKYEDVRTDFSSYRNEIDKIIAGDLEESRVDELMEEFKGLQEKVEGYRKELHNLRDASAGGAYNSAVRDFNTAVESFQECSGKAWDVTYVGTTMNQYAGLAEKYNQVFGLYGAIQLDRVTPNKDEFLGCLRFWRDQFRTIADSMVENLSQRGDILAKISDSSTEIGEVLGNIRSKLSLPKSWEGDLHEFYEALKLMTRPQTATVVFLHRFNGAAEPFDDLTEIVVPMNRNLTLPADCNAEKMNGRMKPGWKFAGWVLKNGTAVESDSYRVTDDRLALYATREELPVKVTFLNEDGESVRVQNLLRDNDKAVLERPEDPVPPWGWKFVGWRQKGRDNLFKRWGVLLSEIVPFDTPNDKLVLVFEPVLETVPFTLTFEDGENTEVHKATVLDVVPEIAGAEKPGWKWIGWSTTEGSATADVEAGKPVADYLSAPATKVTFHAVRQTIPYTVSFLSRTAESADPVPWGKPLVGNVLKAVDEPPAPVLENYEFSGWRVDVADGVPYDFTATLSKDTKLVAAWKPVPHTVRIGSVDGSSLSDYVSGEPWSVAHPLSAPPMPAAEAKYEPLHWTETAPANGATAWFLLPDEEAPDPFAFDHPVIRDLSLYPVFRHRQYTVTFKINNSYVWKTEKVLHGESIEDPGTPPTKGVQLTLRYWQVVPGPPGAYDFSLPVERDFVLTTIWQKKTKPTANP